MPVPLLSALRRNHAIEHATIAVLFERRGRILSVSAWSDPWGFSLRGRFATDEVESAAREAVRRLEAGERSLAVTPFCGTNIALAGVLAGTAALVARGWRRSSLPNALAAAVLGAAAAVPAGAWLQRRVTTDPGAAGARLGSVRTVSTPLGSVVRVGLGRSRA